jgi:Na+/H+-dicarboxylate symporter
MGAETHPLKGARRSGVLTAGALIGLTAGLSAGLAAHSSRAPGLAAAATLVEPLGTLWTNALRMTVVPLVVSNLIVGIASVRDARTLGRLGGASLLVFLALHALAATYTVLITSPVLAALRPSTEVVETFRADRAAAPKEAPAAAAGQEAPSFGEWLTGIVPTNPVKAAADGAILSVVVFTILFALAMTRAQPEHYQLLINFFRAVNEVMLTLVRWILRFAPIGIFALTFSFAARTGPAAVGSLGYFVALVCALLLFFTLALYAVVAIFGRAPLRVFARAAAPAQLVAVSTRSSLASLPAMIEGAEQRLRLPPAVAGFVLPLSVSTFKANRTISSTSKFLFLAGLYGIALSPAQIVSFVVMIVLLSFSTPGLPATGTTRTLPAYLAVGIPIEAVLILDAVDAIPDIFKTLLNVTGDMTAAVIVARFAGDPAALSPLLAEAGTGESPVSSALPHQEPFLGVDNQLRPAERGGDLVV